ncbi:MAG: hypothetical protein U0990_00945 [Candidatus Nanopelagicales bacterium]|nr:hypothetical protein [Candidatus Nanopelagicales bacterium]
MPEFNRTDVGVVKPLVAKLHDQRLRSEKSTTPAPGHVRQTKREARTRYLAEWKLMSPEQRQAQVDALGADSILDLIGGGDNV